SVKMSVNAPVNLSSNEINKRNDKSLKPLFPKREDEENVWKLCEDVSIRVPEELDTCYVVFISNPCRTVPLWKQRAGREEDRLVIWVFFRVVPAKQFLQHFASDRRHMKRPDGSWIKPPPPYPAISAQLTT
ncbi:Protein N-terminal glutamine amidohydrolase, partial [Operophtera brumata]